MQGMVGEEVGELLEGPPGEEEKEGEGHGWWGVDERNVKPALDASFDIFVVTSRFEKYKRT